ncbi:MAG: hypothetical protein QM710_12845 [Flavobacterium sp.]
MKNTLRKIYILLFSVSAFLLSGCSELIDCVASARPNLHSKNLATGTVGGSYTDFLEADITNEPHDNDYDYFFSVHGNLPPGMTYYEQGRKVFFTGTPSQAGTFSFKVTLTVDPPDSFSNGGFWNDSNRICFDDDTITKEFTIVIQ